jgi:Nucleotidyl transferase AbiEii toxin, Type IV TA system
MTRQNPKDTAASVRQRLLNLSRRSGEDFQRVLTRYGMERLLDRLSRSEHAPWFVLKGALLFTLWTGELLRPTRDLDLLGFGESSAEGVTEVFQSLCALEVADDGLVFSAETVAVEPIREDQEYGGQPVKLEGRLGRARIDLQVDIGFGDAITPKAEAVEYPTLLGIEPPRSDNKWYIRASRNR